MACLKEPRSLNASVILCARPPPCPIVSCYRNLLCLIYDTTARLIPNCQGISESSERIYCICPVSQQKQPVQEEQQQDTSLQPYNMTSLVPDMSNNNNNDNTSTTTTVTMTTLAPEGLPGGALAVVILSILFLIVLLAVGLWLIIRKVKERRKKHGEYRPQFEEYQHAKDLPYLPPPAIEGLI